MFEQSFAIHKFSTEVVNCILHGAGFWLK